MPLPRSSWASMPSRLDEVLSFSADFGLFGMASAGFGELWCNFFVVWDAGCFLAGIRVVFSVCQCCPCAGRHLLSLPPQRK